MTLDPSQYHRSIKFLALIPFITGILTFAEIYMDALMEAHQVFEKNENFRLKTQTTTYTVAFDGVDDQFTKEIYQRLSIGDSATLEISPIHSQIKSVTPFQTGIKLDNTTNERFVTYLFGVIYLLTGMVWLKKTALSKKQFSILGFIILLATISLIRVIV